MYIYYLCSQKHLLNILNLSYSKTTDDIGTAGVFEFYFDLFPRQSWPQGHSGARILGNDKWNTNRFDEYIQAHIKYLMPNFRICSQILNENVCEEELYSSLGLLISNILECLYVKEINCFASINNLHTRFSVEENNKIICI